MYLLLGDPSMRIKTHGGLHIEAVILPETLPPWPLELNLQFVDALRRSALHDAVFAVFKPGPGRDDEDEVFDNRYTDANGQRPLTVGAPDRGLLYWTLRGPDGETCAAPSPCAIATPARRSWAADGQQLLGRAQRDDGGQHAAPAPRR